MTHYYKVNCTRDNLRLIREFVNVVLQNLSLSEIEVNQLVLAVDEICSNLIIYSHDCNPDESIEIHIRKQEKDLLFEIIDKDASFFDIKDYKEPEIEKLVQEKRKGGMGLMLVNRIMDSVELTTENKTNTWRLLKRMN